jgi:transmembrane sensor
MEPSKADLEAAEWFSRLKAARNVDDLQPAFHAWLSESEKNRKAYRELEDLWALLEQGHRLGLLGSQPVSSSPVPAPTCAETAVPEHVPPRRVRRKLVPRLAVIAVLSCTGMSHSTQHDSTAAPLARWFRYQTGPYDDVSALKLPDHSTVKLNSDTAIQVRLTRQRREVILERGDAQFTVTNAATRPFEVSAGASTVQVLGTVFAVRLKEHGEVETIVTGGKVALSAQSDSPTHALEKGQAARVSRGRIYMERPLARSDDPRVAWIEGKLDFGEGEPLWKVVRDFNRCNHNQLEIADPRIANITVGGSFKKHDPEGFARGLQVLDIQATVSDSHSAHLNVIFLTRQTR